MSILHRILAALHAAMAALRPSLAPEPERRRAQAVIDVVVRDIREQTERERREAAYVRALIETAARARNPWGMN